MELARFFGYSHDVLAIMDRGGRILVVSPSVQRVLSRPPEVFWGEPLMDWIHPEDQAGVRARFLPLLDGIPVEDMDVRMARVNGEWIPMRWSLSMGVDGRIYGVGRDYTEQIRHRNALLRQERAELGLRTAMELHDGILQTLTGATLQIAAARRLISTNPQAADEVLEALGASVSAEQQEMRLYVDELKGSAPVWSDGSLGLANRIRALLDRVGMIWGLTTSADVRVEGEVGGELGRQMLRIIQEGTVNAARHGGAKSVSVEVAPEGRNIVISIADDGQGFSFHGEFDHEALKVKRLGPLSLKHRVEETGGSISINSTTGGSRVLVRLPNLMGEASG